MVTVVVGEVFPSCDPTSKLLEVDVPVTWAKSGSCIPVIPVMAHEPPNLNVLGYRFKHPTLVVGPAF